MLKEKIKDNIILAKKADSWQEAVRLAASPLLKNKNITENYIDAIIKNININGPYIIILPKLAIPHARPEEGVLETGLAFLKLDEPVEFPENNPVNILITLAAKDGDTHMEMLSELTDILLEKYLRQALFDAKSIQDVLACL